MSEVKGPQRLGKAAVTLGVSKDTIVEFLSKKGVTIENNPMAKIEADAYEMLLGEFAGDQAAKEKSAATAAKVRESRSTITLADTKKTKGSSKEDEEPEIDYSKFKRKVEVKEKPAPKPVEPVAESPVEPVAEIAPKKTTKKEEEEPAKEEEKVNEVKVVGKIDLASLEKPKTKGRKKKEDTPEPAEETKPATKGKAKKAVEEPAPVIAPEPQPEPEKTPEPEKELIRVNVQKLSGVKLMGKIDLPTEPEKKKADAANSEAEKRKRKRVGKVDIQRQQEIDRRQRNTVKPAEPKKTELSEQDIQNQVKATLARLGGQGKSKSSKFRREKRDFVARRSEEEAARQQAENLVLKLTADVIEQIAEEEDSEDNMVTRPPVITVMGHVDHGKTSLLDFVRKANVIAGEAGGITQHIGAYSVELTNGRKITFLDTPGHEAFTAMRARGAKVTDLAIIVIAADDSVMPQTKEAISHAQAAGVPMIFAFNKIDKPGANSDKIREQLSGMNILVEEWGGKFQSQEISAKKGLNIDALLEKVLLESDMLNLKANPDKRAVGTVIESALDKGRGYVTTLLVEAGTLRVGDAILAGHTSGRVKAMFNERGQKVNEAGPATPVSLLGFEGAPNAGDKFNVMEDEREARNIALKRQQLQREQSLRTKKHLTIEEIGRRIALGDFKELNLIVKGDVDGSVEALTDSLQKLSTEKIQVRIIHKGVGQISESDVLLASASDAIIIGFQVRPSAPARKIAENEEIQIKLYSIIYKAIEEVKEAMEGMLSARIEEQITGTAEIREVFKITKVGTIAGCMVLDGKIGRTSKVRVIRDGIVIYTGELGSLKRFKDDVKEVVKGYECGLNIDRFNNIEVGDNVEAFEEVEVKQTL